MFDILLLVLTNQFCSSNFRNEISSSSFEENCLDEKYYETNQHQTDNREKKGQLCVLNFQHLNNIWKRILNSNQNSFLTEIYLRYVGTKLGPINTRQSGLAMLWWRGQYRKWNGGTSGGEIDEEQYQVFGIEIRWVMPTALHMRVSSLAIGLRFRICWLVGGAKGLWKQKNGRIR